MPRVEIKTKNKAGVFPCDRCAETIKPGEKYYKWSFRYGGTHRQHASHGRPKQSQLTQSKMSGVYAAIESAEDEIAKSDEPADIATSLNDCANSVEEVKEEYADGLSNLPQGLQDAGGPGGQTQEKIDALEGFVSSLQDAANDIEGEEFEPDTEGKSEDELKSEKEEWVEDLRQKATDALGELSV